MPGKKLKIVIHGKKYSAVDTRVTGADIRRLPYSLRVLLENVLRNNPDDVPKVLDYLSKPGTDISWFPSRVLMQDFTGVPCVVDLASMRDTLKERGGDPAKIDACIPVDLVIDHSVQIDYWASPDALEKNIAVEYRRNAERYRLLKWASATMKKLRVVPPGSGICHQINLEYLASVVSTSPDGMDLFPDSLVGTDSHTTMVNALGVMGWGVGGIEAEAVMLGQPYIMPVPEVVGVRLDGQLSSGVFAADLVLTLTQMLRKKGVVGKFVEFYGPGLSSLSLPDRATVANMAPEYGATMGFFPVDETVIAYLEETGRAGAAKIAEAYCRQTGLFHDADKEPEYNDMCELDLSSVRPSIAGPFRPQDRIDPEDLPVVFGDALEKIASGERGNGRGVVFDGRMYHVPQGAVAIAAITSCTNTSNPSAMIGAGLVAQKAAARGMKPPVWVKTSMAPGSRVVMDYLVRSGLDRSLEEIGFGLSAFGCTTCIGNSGPLPEGLSVAADSRNLVLASVLSGNRNFEARIHQSVRLNFLMSPLYVVAYAIAGTVDIDIEHDPIGTDSSGRDVFLADIWPTDEEIEACVSRSMDTGDFTRRYKDIFAGDATWNSLEAGNSTCFGWDPGSGYIRRPGFAESGSFDLSRLTNTRILGFFGDSVTTDHISPAGEIPADYPAGKYLSDMGIRPFEFNSYGSRRGNHEVMVRGTFANIRLKNRLASDAPGGYTRIFPDGRLMFMYDAAMEYMKNSVPLVVIAGREYGTGSSRDWAAKGTGMLGVSMVIAQSYERIHRGNLVGMGVLPLTFLPGESADSVGIRGHETISIISVSKLVPGARLKLVAEGLDGTRIEFDAICQLLSDTELSILLRGGLLPFVLDSISSSLV